VNDFLRLFSSGGSLKKTKRLSQSALWNRAYNFFSLVEQLPYGASIMQEKKVSRGILGLGVLVMAVGAAIFATGWTLHWNWLVEIAFVITLVGWMMVILGFAFWVVSHLAQRFPIKRDKN
jgi:hypothetical protein